MPAESRAEVTIVVLDTNVLLSLYVFADSRFAPLRSEIETGHWQAITNAACLEEFERVLAYPLFRLDARQQAEALQSYRRVARLAEIPPKETPVPRCTDPDDQKFLELARDSGAQCLVTSDKALLKLAKRLQKSGMFRVITPDYAMGNLSSH